LTLKNTAENQKACRNKNKEKFLFNERNLRLKNLLSWVEAGIIPEKTNCQICGKELFFRNDDLKKVIHFDHKSLSGYSIDYSAKAWLQSSYANEKNVKIWKDNDFGYLCRICNCFLPTGNRKQIAQSIYDYVFPKINL